MFDGEILIGGVFVFDGYWCNDVVIKEMLDDGWLHFGDIGWFDLDGFVIIIGCKKEFIVIVGGKNVAPTVLEDRLRAHWLVSQCMVVGDRRPFIACLITLDPDALESWKAEAGKFVTATVVDLREDVDLLYELQEVVDVANEVVFKVEFICWFVILGDDFTELGG